MHRDERLRVLVVEDEAVIALSLSIGVQSAGHELVGTADNGVTALAIADRFRPHAALVDVKLKGAIDGMTVGRELAQRYGSAVIFATAYQDRVLKESRDVAFGLLIKPFAHAQVAEELARVAKAVALKPPMAAQAAPH